MGRSVPEGYLYREEYVLGDRRAVVLAPAATIWKKADRQRQMAALVHELLACGDDFAADIGQRCLAEMHKNDDEKTC